LTRAKPRAANRIASSVDPARILRLVAETVSQPTAPFREGAVIRHVLRFVAARPHLAVRVDRDGNLLLRRRAVRPSATPLVVVAHMDHPGFHAVRCEGRGRRFLVSARFLGGVRPEFFRGARVRFFDGEEAVRARVARVRRDAKGGELAVTLVAERAVSPGSFGMWDLPPLRAPRGGRGRLASRAIDDLVGVAAGLALLDAVDAIDPRRRVDVRALFTRGEEVGFVGALAVAGSRRLPRGARILSLEASRALANARQGDGPILRIGDRTSSFDDGLSRWMARTATALAGPKGDRFPWQRRLMDGGTCEATAFQQHGFRCAALCVPLGNYHNMGDDGRIRAETIDPRDAVGLVRLLEALVRNDADCPRRGAPDPLRRRLDDGLRRHRRALAGDPFA
jgi:endoglucanase